MIGNLRGNTIFNFGAFIFLFFIVFDLKIIGSIGSAIIPLLVCFCLIVIRDKYYQNLNLVVSNLRYFLLFYFILLFYVLIRVLFSSLDDISYLLTMLKTTLILISMIFYLAVFYNSDIKNNLFNIFFINSIVCLIFGSFPELKFMIYPFKYGDDPGSSLIGFNEYRDSMLSGSSYFGISSLFGLAFAFLLKITIEENKISNYMKLLVISIVGVLAGRVALLCYVLSLVYFFLFKKSYKVLLFAFFSFIIFIFLLNTLPVLESAKFWFYEMFLGSGVGESESVSQLKDMLYLPSNELTILFGDARYGDSKSYYGGSDSGFVRNILFGGFIYLFILMIAFISIFKGFLKFGFVYLMILISLVLHFKGVFVFNNPGFWGIILSVVLVLLNEKRDKK